MPRKQPAWPGIITTVLGALWLGAFPLWQDLSYAHITRAKWVGMLVLTGVTLLAVLLCVLILAAKKQLRQVLRWHPVQLVAVGYFAWVALSALLGEWAGTFNAQGQRVVWMGAIRYEGLLTHLCYAAIFLLMSFFPPRMKAVLAAASAALMLFAGVVALQYAGVNVLGLFPAGRSIYANYEFQGTIGNIDMVSGYLSLVVPLLLGAFVTREKAGWHLLAAGTLGAALEWCMEVQSGLIALLLLCGLLVLLALRFPAYRQRACIALAGIAAGLALRGMLFLPWLDSATPRAVQPVVFTMTGKAFIGVSAVAVLMVAAAIFRRHPGRAVPGKAILCLVLVAAVLAVTAVAVLPVPQSAGGLYELHELLNGRPQDQFGSWRLGAWRYALDMSRDSLIFGNGPDTFYYALAEHLQQVGVSLGENFDNPHNEYVAILSNNGLPALLLYLALLAGVLIACIRGKQWALALGIGCYGAQGFFSFSICLVSPMFWAVMGMASAMLGKKLQSEQKRAIIGDEVNET
ncbi:MAG: O-antigen ligase family protein [Clostridia bacterium]|nr:O-antigen ligase family protein [Clostridia bacterium]